MATAHVDRRLVAILAADMVGYSRLMEADETGTIARQKAHRLELVDPEIGAHGGRIVKTTGDGILIEFPSVVAATECAVAIQRAMAEREARVSDERRIQYRVGINLGDIVIDGDDILGDGVNVAARLEGLAEPGGVCISDVVHQSVAGKLDLTFEDMGEQQVKNISRPVRVYQWSVGKSTARGGTQPNQKNPLPEKPSIAVLPFNNMSGDPEQEYFSDGMAEDLITDISNISGLLVIARNSSFAFKGQAIDVKEVAAKLGVKHILEGSVRKMGSKLRVNAQLIDAASGGHIWAQRYDGDMEDIFEFQDNIREQIVAALRVSLTPTDKARTENKPTDNVEAYDLFLKGRASYHRYTSENLLEARKCFEEAIEIDPNFADAYAYLSYCHFQAWFQLGPEFDDNFERANELAERGVALDSTSAVALTRLGWIQTFMRRHDQAIANMEKAFALAPNNADVNATFGQILNYWGDPKRGLKMMEKAFSLEMFVPPNWEFQVGCSRLLLRQYDQAASRFLKTIERAPKWVPGYLYLASAYAGLDRLEDARDATKQVLEIDPQYTVNEAARQYPFRLDEVRNHIFDSFRKAGLPEG